MMIVSIVVSTQPLQAATQTVSSGNKPYFTQGVRLLKKKQFKKAIEKFTLVTTSVSENENLPALAFYHRGLAHQALGMFDEARKDYNSAVKLHTLKDSVLYVVY